MGGRVGHKRKQPYEARQARQRRRDDYDRVWAWETAEEQACWDEAQLEARDASADRFEREHGEDVP